MLFFLGIFLLQFLLKFVILPIHLVFQGQQMDDVLTLLLRIFLERMEVCLIVFYDDLIDHQFLYVIRHFLTNIDKEDQGFEEVLLLTEVILILLTGNLEGIHGDRSLFGIRDIGAMIVTADTLIGVTRINKHNICVLNKQLANYTVHVE